MEKKTEKELQESLINLTCFLAVKETLENLNEIKNIGQEKFIRKIADKLNKEIEKFNKEIE